VGKSGRPLTEEVNFVSWKNDDGIMIWEMQELSRLHPDWYSAGEKTIAHFRHEEIELDSKDGVPAIADALEWAATTFGVQKRMLVPDVRIY
jgi:hypothetical protein